MNSTSIKRKLALTLAICMLASVPLAAAEESTPGEVINPPVAEETTPDSGETGGETTPDGGETGGEITPDGGETGGEIAPDGGETGGETTPDSGETGGETTPDSGETGGETTPDGGETGGETTPDSGETGGETVPVLQPIEAEASVSGSTINVTVTHATPGITLLATLITGGEPISKHFEGDTVSFTDLKAGTYSVVVSYISEGSDEQSKLISDLMIEELPPQEEPIVASAMVFAAPPSTGVGAIAGSVTAEMGKTVVVSLIKDNNIVGTQELPDTHRDFRFDNLTPGEYRLEFSYKGDSTVKFSLTQTVTEEKATASAITASATGSQNRVDVSVTTASPLPINVQLLLNGTPVDAKTIAAGIGSVTFEGVKAGVYTVSIDYEQKQPGVSSTVIDKVTVIDKPAAIAFQNIVGGENQLVITGTAQPNTDITLTTEPASTTTIVHSDAKGLFTASITCQAGTYTAVHAQYGSDQSTRISAKGSFEVKAPSVKPTLSVDPIHPGSITVIAHTTPGITVNLATSDFGQTRVADSRGLLRYSLPHTYAKDTVITFTIYYGDKNINSFQQQVTVADERQYLLLRRGTVSQDVVDLTQRLHDLGYPIGPTRRYDDSVVAAVRLFQQVNGLSVDGMAGQLTQTMLYSVSAIPYSPDQTVYPTLVRGDRGLTLIYTLQQRLKDLGYYTIRVDGIYGSGTQRAVRWFQEINGLTVTGTADNATQQLLYSSSAKPASGYAPSSYQTLQRSSRYHAAVVPLQRRLKSLGYLAGSVDGYFGSQTYRAVRSFQSRNGLSVTGKADEYTQQVLYSSSAKPASVSSSGSSSSTGYRLLYWGCRGDSVRRLQQSLLNSGYKQVRAVDGIYGQWTYDAVKAFQKDHGLSVDGIAGKNTQNALYGTHY